MELKFGDIQETALIPLAIKASETSRPNARIKDLKAKERDTVKNINVNEVDIDIELVKRMVEWDRHHRVLESWKFQVMQDVAIGLKPLNEKLKWGFRLNLKTLLLHGFDEL